MIAGIVFLSILSLLKAQAFLSPDLQALKIDFEADEGAIKAVLFFNPGTKWYFVAEKPNLHPEIPWQDSLVWFSKGKWKGGNLQIEVLYQDERRKEKLISEGEILVRDFGMTKDIPMCEANRSLPDTWVQDPYAWRMLGYDAQHTGYYPFPLHPPLEFKWTFSGIRSHDFLMMQGCAAHGMLYVGDGESNWIEALDLETGEIVWERELTSNVWCAALCPGDSILFVGTSIGWPPESLSTFFALDPTTGEEKWSVWLHTVEYSPITVDTFVYATTGQADTLFALTLGGDLVWKDRVTRLSPAYWEDRIYGPKEPFIWDPNDTLHVFYCRDALTGDSVWAFPLLSLGHSPSVYDSKVFFFAADTLFAVSVVNGIPMAKNSDFPGYLNAPLQAEDGIYLGYGEYGLADTILSHVRSFDSDRLGLEWESYLRPRDIDGGRMTRLLLTQGSLLWAPNKDYIYTLDRSSGDSLHSILLPESPQIWGSWGFPIAYRNCFVGAHRSFVYVYAADTSTPPLSEEIVFSFSVIQDWSVGRIGFLIILPHEEEISIMLYDVAGCLRSTIYQGTLKKGGNRIEWRPERLSQGVYICLLKGSSFQRAEKIVYLRGGLR